MPWKMFPINFRQGAWGRSLTNLSDRDSKRFELFAFYLLLTAYCPLNSYFV
jgi:hypothetical protein